MELIFLGLSHLADISRPLVMVILALLFASGVWFAVRGYWIYKRRLKIAGAINGVLLGFLVASYMIYNQQAGGLDFLDSLLNEPNKYLLSGYVVTFVVLFALVGYLTAHWTFVVSLVLWGAFAGFLTGNLFLYGKAAVFDNAWMTVSSLGVVFALIGGFLTFLSLRTFIIMATAFLGAYLAANVAAFYFLEGYAKFDEYVRTYEYLLNLLEVKTKIDMGIGWISLYDDGFKKAMEGMRVSPSRVQYVTFYYLYLGVFTAVLFFYGVHYQMEYAHKKTLEENEQLRARLQLSGADLQLVVSDELSQPTPGRVPRQGFGQWLQHKVIQPIRTRVAPKLAATRQQATDTAQQYKQRMDEKAAAEGGYQAYAQHRIQPVLATIKRHSLQLWAQLLPWLRRAGHQVQAVVEQLQVRIRQMKEKQRE